eukprot:20921-Heterococcus_DN1.PRE.5
MIEQLSHTSAVPLKGAMPSNMNNRMHCCVTSQIAARRQLPCKPSVAYSYQSVQYFRRHSLQSIDSLQRHAPQLSAVTQVRPHTVATAVVPARQHPKPSINVCMAWMWWLPALIQHTELLLLQLLALANSVT